MKKTYSSRKEKIMKSQHEEGFFKSSQKNSPLFYQSFLADKEETQKNLVFVHGAQEHSGRYKHLIKSLNQKNISCFGFDIKGHGKSPGARGDTASFSEFLEDLDCFLAFIEKKYKAKKPILLGHSLGGLIVLSYALEEKRRKKLAGVYASAPALSVKLTPSMKIKQFLGKNLFIKIAPKLSLPVGLNLNSITHDPIELEKYKNDPLVFKNMSVRQGLNILKQGEKTIKQASKIKDFPIFLAHGDEDDITFNEGTKEFYKRLSSEKKKIKIYKNYYHELFNETLERREQVFSDLIAWCEEIL